MNFERNILYFLLLILTQSALAQDLRYDQYTTDDGLPSNTIYEIVQDSNGLLWMGTENGLVSYNGETFERFSDPRLKDNDIIQLEISKDGHITFSNVSNQYCRIEVDSIVVFDVSCDKYLTLKSTQDADYLYDTDQIAQICIYDNGIVCVGVDPFIALGLDSMGHLLYYIDCLKQYKSNWFDQNNTRCILDREIIKLSSYKAKGDYGYYIIQAREIWSVDSLLYDRIENKVFRNILKVDDRVFVMTTDGLFVYDSVKADYSLAIKDFVFNFGFMDRDGDLWLTSTDKGVIKVSLNEFNVYSSPFDGGIINDIILVENNIITLSNSRLTVFDDQQELLQSAILGTAYKQIALVENDEIFVFDVRSVSIYDVKSNRLIEKVPEDINRSVYKNGVVVNDRFYLASAVAIISCEYENEHRFIEKYANSISKTNVMVGSDSTGFIYVGTDNGLFQFHESDYTPVEIKGVLSGKHIQSLFYNNEGELFIGTSNSGLFFMDKAGEINSIDIFSCI